MNKMALAAGPQRDWLSELRGAEGRRDIDEFTDLLGLVAVAAPELREPASVVARGFGEGDPGEEARWQEWARGFFIYPKPQPGEELRAEIQPAVPKALVVKRRKLPSPKSYAELKAEIEAEPASEPKQEEPKTKQAEPAPEPEAEPVEDPDNAANNVRRRLWRFEGALEYLNPEEWASRVGPALWWMSRDNREAGCAIWVNWIGEDGRLRWHTGFDGELGSVEAIYHAAQLAGWRFPITNNSNRLHEMVEQSEAALVRGGVDIYQSVIRLVRPVRVSVPAAPPAGSTQKRETTVARLDGINEPWLRPTLTRHINYVKWDKNEKPSGSGVPDGLANGILNRHGEWKFPKVTGIITAPTLRRDGSVLAKEGWDPETGLLVMGPLPPMPEVAARPTKDVAYQAIKWFDDLLSEFPFVDEPSRSVALSGLITPVVRGALDCVPGHAASAPAAGTGKSLLWDLSAGIAIGDAMPVISTGEGQDEFSKRIESQMLSGMALWSIDNVSVPIKGDAFCQAIERPNPNIRVMGGNQVRSCRNIWSIYITGNNLRVIGDATRRVIQAKLDAKTAFPEQRKFRGDPFGMVLRNRGQYICAALTIVRAYLETGQPDRLPWVGQPFGQWSDLVRSALVWLGYEDPVKSIETIRQGDPIEP